MPGCVSCGLGYCEECHLPDDKCCLTDIEYSHRVTGNTSVSASAGGRPPKLDADVKDPRSTMRKRAQKILREARGIQIGDPCEWRGLANIGGGNHPIVGCRSGVVSHIHHGPDKDWYHNTPDNLSAICNFCHNRWHSQNDGCYNPTKPNEPRKATQLEIDTWNPLEGRFRLPIHDHSACESFDYRAPDAGSR